MKYAFALTVLLSAVASASAPVAADVIATDGAVIIKGGRYLNEDNASGPFYRRDRVIITNGNSGNNVLVIKDGRVSEPKDGSHDLGNGSRINVENGRVVNGNVGRVQIRN